MDKALEALEGMRNELEFLWRWVDRLNGGQPHDNPEENWRGYAEAMRHYPGNPMDCGDWTREKMAAPVRAALEAKAEPVAWCDSDALRDRCSGFMVFKEQEDDLDTPLYTAPPTADQIRAEAMAEATELALLLVMDEWGANLDDWTADGIKNTLLKEAARLRGVEHD